MKTPDVLSFNNRNAPHRTAPNHKWTGNVRLQCYHESTGSCMDAQEQIKSMSILRRKIDKLEQTMGHINIFQLTGFISSCRQLLPSIRQGWRDQRNNEILPANIISFLCTYTRMTIAEVHTCWKIFEEDIQRSPEDPFTHLMPTLSSSTVTVNELHALELGKY